MSGIHNGHYIAAAQNEYTGLVTSLLSSVPWEMGHTLDRWKTSLNVALEKIPGVRHISKVRTILLLESDYNTGTKHIYANRTMHNAAKHRQIP